MLQARATLNVIVAFGGVKPNPTVLELPQEPESEREILSEKHKL